VHKQELVSAAHVAAAAELGLEQRDVEDAGEDSTRLVWRRQGSEWHVGEGSGAGLHGGGLRSSTVACAAVMARCAALAAGGTRQAASGVARRGEAGARPVSGGTSGETARGSDQGSAEAAGRRTGLGSGGGVQQRRSRGGRERGRRRRTQMQF
jgi:hypothetical protein